MKIALGLKVAGLLYPALRREIVKAIEREKTDGDENDGELLSLALIILDRIFNYRGKGYEHKLH